MSSKNRTYLTVEEKTILESLLKEWSTKADKKERDAFVSAEVLPKIQQLNVKEFGPEVISTDKVAKVKWEQRVAVSASVGHVEALSISHSACHQSVFTWFKNHKPFRDRKVFRLQRKTPLRRVVGKLKED